MRKFDKLMETKYRDYCHDDDNLLLGAAVVLTIALSIAFTLFDSSAFAWSGKMVDVFLKRGLLMLIAIALWFVFWKKILRDRWWDNFVLGVGVAVSINYYFIAGQRALYDPLFYQHPAFVAASLFWIVLFTFMVPIYGVLPKIITTVLFTTIVTVRMAPGITASHEGMVLVIAYVLISAVCLLISLRGERYRRQIFLQYQQELSTRSALEKAGCGTSSEMYSINA